MTLQSTGFKFFAKIMRGSCVFCCSSCITFNPRSKLNELPTNEKLNAEISNSQNATFASVFPERAKPLLHQHLYGDGLHGLV